MGRTTGIEWTDATWNPIRGCSRVSEGCRNCYAETVANRFSGPGKPYEGLVQLGADGKGNGKWNGQIAFVEKHLLDPLRMKTPSRIFVNSMSDLFHEGVTDEMLDRIFAVMALCPQHTFQVLTKRPERMLRYFNLKRRSENYSKTITNDTSWYIWRAATAIQGAAKSPIPGPFRWTTFEEVDTIAPWPLPNVWLGVSVEDQKAADERIPLLLQTPAVKRFVSVEPMLGAVNLKRIDWVVEMERSLRSMATGDGSFAGSLLEMADDVKNCDWSEGRAWRDVLTGAWFDGWDGDDNPVAEHAKLDWVICGGESGPGARPMHPVWARSLRDQCVAAGVPFFFKQWGEWKDGGDARVSELVVYRDGRSCSCTREDILAEERRSGKPHGGAGATMMSRVGKKAAGRLLDGREWNEMPEVAR